MLSAFTEPVQTHTCQMTGKFSDLRDGTMYRI